MEKGVSPRSRINVNEIGIGDKDSEPTAYNQQLESVVSIEFNLHFDKSVSDEPRKIGAFIYTVQCIYGDGEKENDPTECGESAHDHGIVENMHCECVTKEKT